MRRANPSSTLVMLGVQAVVALVLGIAATLLVRLAGTTAPTIMLVVLLSLFFYALLTFARAVPVTRRWGP